MKLRGWYKLWSNALLVSDSARNPMIVSSVVAAVRVSDRAVGCGYKPFPGRPPPPGDGTENGREEKIENRRESEERDGGSEKK